MSIFTAKLWHNGMSNQTDFAAVSINFAIWTSLSDNPPTSWVLNVTWS